MDALWVLIVWWTLASPGQPGLMTSATPLNQSYYSSLFECELAGNRAVIGLNVEGYLKEPGGRVFFTCSTES